MKNGVILLLLIAIVAAVGFVIYEQRDHMRENPWDDDVDLHALSVTVRDKSGNLYMIGNSKRTIYKVDATGTLQYEIDAGQREDGRLEIFTDMAVDDDGNLYVASTLLDSYGLYVRAENIVFYGTQGGHGRTIYTIDHGEQSERLRIGTLQSLKIIDGELHFFINEETQFQFVRISKRGQTETLLAAELPEGVYAADFSTNDSRHIFFTSKNGPIYGWDDAADVPRLLYPIGNAPNWAGLTVPDKLVADMSGRLYFINHYRGEINRIHPQNPYLVEKVLFNDLLRERGWEADLVAAEHLYVDDDGSLIVTLENGILIRSDEGMLTDWIQEASYKLSRMFSVLLIWTLAIAGALFVLYMLRFVYVRIMQRRMSLLLKQLIVFIPLLIVSMAFLANEVMRDFNEKMTVDSFRELALIAHNGSRLIGTNLLDHFNSAADYNSPQYKQLKEHIHSVYEGDDGFERRGTYTTIYKWVEGRLYIISDDDDSVKMFTPSDVTEESRAVLERGEIVYEAWEGPSGRWVYALGPLYDSEGNIIGIYETGKDMVGFEQHNREIIREVIQRITLFVIVILLIFSAITYYLLKPIRRLLSSVNDLAAKRWDTEVRVRTRDEVGELGQRFNFMAEQIRKYIADITEMNKAYFRFVPQKFLQMLNIESVLDARLGVQVERDMSVMVCGMHDFYEFSKTLSPDDNFKFVNSFLSRFGPVIREHRGIVNHYFSTGMMSLFPQNSQDAIQAAIQIREALIVYNRHRATSGYPAIDVGIAIHKGPLMLGVIGEEERLESNVISDKVSLAHILQRLTVTVGSSILITEDALATVQHTDLFLCRSLGRVRIPEHSEPLKLFDVYQGDPEPVRNLKHKTKRTFEEAVLMYQEGRFYDAREAFLEVIKVNRYDRAAQLYFYMSDKFFQSGVYDEWDGTLSA